MFLGGEPFAYSIEIEALEIGYPSAKAFSSLIQVMPGLAYAIG